MRKIPKVIEESRRNWLGSYTFAKGFLQFLLADFTPVAGEHRGSFSCFMVLCSS